MIKRTGPDFNKVPTCCRDCAYESIARIDPVMPDGRYIAFCDWVHDYRLAPDGEIPYNCPRPWEGD